MSLLLSGLPLWAEMLILVIVPTIAAMCGPILLRHWSSYERLSSNNEIAGFKFATVGVIYSVLVAFAVIVVWEKFNDAEAAVVQEAGAADTLYRLTAGPGPSSSRADTVNRRAKSTSLVPAVPSSALPCRPAVSLGRTGTPAPSTSAYSMSGRGPGGGIGNDPPLAVADASAAVAARAAAPLASADRPGAEGEAGQAGQQPPGAGEGDFRAGQRVHLRQARRLRAARQQAELLVAGSEPVLASPAVIPGPPQRNRPRRW